VGRRADSCHIYLKSLSGNRSFCFQDSIKLSPGTAIFILRSFLFPGANEWHYSSPHPVAVGSLSYLVRKPVSKPEVFYFQKSSEIAPGYLSVVPIACSPPEVDDK
jgi:hypothetical protein